MRTLFYILAICLAALFLFVTVNRIERNRPLATLLMILLLGITAAAVLKQSDALSAAVANGTARSLLTKFAQDHCGRSAGKFWGYGVASNRPAPDARTPAKATTNKTG